MSFGKYTFIICDQCNYQDPGGTIGDTVKDARQNMKNRHGYIYKHGKDFCDEDCLKTYEIENKL